MLEIKAGCIRHRRGDTGTINLSLKLDTGEAYTLNSDDRAVFSVKKTCNSTEYVMQKTLVDSQLIFEHDDTKNLPHGEYCYDIEVTLADGQVHTVANGKYCLLPDITV